MKTKFRSRLVSAMIGVSAASLPLSALAQSLSAPQAADNAWAKLQLLAAPIPLGSLGTSVDPASVIALEANQFLQASRSAKAFYTAFPGDVFAGEARKLEVMSGLQSVEFGNTPYQQTALELATAYAGDAANALSDRFDVALTASLFSPKATGVRLTEDAAAYEALADGLRSQFGDLTQVYRLYLSIMGTVPVADGAELALKIQDMNAPAWAKAEAQRTLDRVALVGRPIDLGLLSQDNVPIRLDASGSGPTVVYVWSNRIGTADLDALAQYASAIPQGTRVVYVSLQSSAATAGAAQAAPVPGFFCFDPSSLDGLIARTLGVQQIPYVYVIDGQGRLSGFGPPSRLAALLSAAAN
jgi:hypothetical protein